MDLALALELAERGRYTVSPNPMVGAVIVRGGRVVGEGFHRRAGGPHAEVSALAKAGKLARGRRSLRDARALRAPGPHASVRGGDRLRQASRRVVVAASDPNPLVAGRGSAALRRGGVAVLAAAPEQRRRAELQNERFRVWITERRPFVLAKWARQSRRKDRDRARGRAAGSRVRKRGGVRLLLREEYDAVLVGAGTVLADDPRLTRRLGENRITPHRRIVLDGRLRVPAKARASSAIPKA